MKRRSGLACRTSARDVDDRGKDLLRRICNEVGTKRRRIHARWAKGERRSGCAGCERRSRAGNAASARRAPRNPVEPMCERAAGCSPSDSRRRGSGAMHFARVWGARKRENKGAGLPQPEVRTIDPRPSAAMLASVSRCSRRGAFAIFARTAGTPAPVGARGCAEASVSFIERAKLHGANALLGAFTHRGGFDKSFDGMKIVEVRGPRGRWGGPDTPAANSRAAPQIGDGSVRCTVPVERKLEVRLLGARGPPRRPRRGSRVGAFRTRTTRCTAARWRR